MKCREGYFGMKCDSKCNCSSKTYSLVNLVRIIILCLLIFLLILEKPK
jgi:hypothetical protein